MCPGDLTAGRCSGLPHTIAEAQSLIHRRLISPAELVAEHVRRAEEHNTYLNAIVTSTADVAVEVARLQGDALARGEDVGALAGIPFTAKDTVATQGVRTTHGSALFLDDVPAHDATAVARLRAAGAILVGKTNCPEFAMGLYTWNPTFGHTLGPVDSLSPGGSSGGEASAVGAGFSLFGIGTDFGGSLRWPAACVGVAALRPTAGSVPTFGMYPSADASLPAGGNPITLQGRVQVIGPITRTALDALLVTRLIAGEDYRDSQTLPVAFSEPEPISLSRLRIGWCLGSERLPVDTETAAAIRGLLAGLESQGVRCEEIPTGWFERCSSLYDDLRRQETHAHIRAVATGRFDVLSPPVRKLLESNPSVPSAHSFALWESRERLRWNFLQEVADLDAVVLPVSSRPALSMEETYQTDILASLDTLNFCRAISLLGLPAVAVPIGRDYAGRPLGVQVVAAPFREVAVAEVAHLIETLVEEGVACSW